MRHCIKDWGSRVMDDYLGYSPTSTSIKPAHIANGLFRMVMGQTTDTSKLNQWLTSQALSEPTGDFATMLEQYWEPIADIESANQFRSLMRKVLDADKAAYPSGERSVFSSSHISHITAEKALERKIGTWVFQLLTYDLGAGSSPILSVLRKYLEDGTDELSFLSQPLLKWAEVTRNSDPLDPPGQRMPVGLVRRLRPGFDQLARHEELLDAKLPGLRRIVLYSCFCVYQHLTTLAWDMVEPDSKLPLLLHSGVQSNSLTAASNWTYELARNSISKLFDLALRPILKQEGLHRLSLEALHDYIDRMPLEYTQLQQSKGRDGDADRKAFKKLFAALNQSLSPFDAFVATVAERFFSQVSVGACSPPDFIRTFGVRIGLLAPRANRATRKVYEIDAALLEILVLSICPLNQEIRLEVFAEQLWERYGIVFGAGPSDLERLEKCGAVQSTPGDLDEALAHNAERLADHLVSMGFAHKYADGVTMIRVREGVS